MTVDELRRQLQYMPGELPVKFMRDITRHQWQTIGTAIGDDTHVRLMLNIDGCVMNGTGLVLQGELQT